MIADEVEKRFVADKFLSAQDGVAVAARRILPHQPIADDIDDPADDPPIIPGLQGIPGLTGDRVVDATTGLLRAGDGLTPPDGYNTNPPNYFETPLERTQATGLGFFRVNDNLEVYGDFFHNRGKVTLNLAPSGA